MHPLFCLWGLLEGRWLYIVLDDTWSCGILQVVAVGDSSARGRRREQMRMERGGWMWLCSNSLAWNNVMALYVWNLYVALTRAHLLLHINITYVVFLPVALARANLLVGRNGWRRGRRRARRFLAGDQAHKQGGGAPHLLRPGHLRPLLRREGARREQPRRRRHLRRGQPQGLRRGVVQGRRQRLRHLARQLPGEAAVPNGRIHHFSPISLWFDIAIDYPPLTMSLAIF